MSRLLVSVRSASEAREALAGGCDLLDAKDPQAGALGAVNFAVLTELLAIAGPCPVSAALGELGTSLPAVPEGLTLVKVGLAGWKGRDWPAMLAQVRRPGLVAAAYADHERAQSPAPEEILETAQELRLAAFLLDTWAKDGRGLLFWCNRDRLARLVFQAQQAALPIALAGSLTRADIVALRDLAPDWFAVRGAACEGGRLGVVTRRRVAELAAILKTPVASGPATLD